MGILARIPLLAWLCLAGLPAHAAEHAAQPDQLPSGAAERFVSVSAATPAASLTVVTQALAIRESGPAETVARFGETYAFSPNVLIVRRGEPTRITFRNLQPDDLHDFLLLAPDATRLAHLFLPALHDVSYTFVFQQEGLFPFACTLHPPVMSGQILVLPPAAGAARDER
jgi:plastocyanin